MRDHFIDRLHKIAEKNKDVVLVTGDLGFGVFNDYRAKLPEQFINAGVAEQNMTGLATGMAMEGFRVFTYSIANFSTLRCLEQIRNDACYHDANVTVVSIGGGFSYGSLGISHHATEDLSIMRSLPEITVVSPGDCWEVQEATTALTQQSGTNYLRLDKDFAPLTNKDGEKFELGKIRQITEGTDLSIFATGGILKEALLAEANLKEKGISCRVHSVHTLKPFDVQTCIEAAEQTGGILTLEENTIDGGLGGLVAENLLEAGKIPKSFYRMGLRAGFSSVVGSQSYLRQIYGLDAEAIVEKVQEMLKK